MTQESLPSTSTMKSRVISVVAQMKGSITKVSQFFGIGYDAPGVRYDQPRFTYDFTSNRGEMDPRNISTPSMKGR